MSNGINLTLQRTPWAAGQMVMITPEQFIGELTKRLPHITENIVSETIVTAAINDGLKYRRMTRFMALKDKADHFAERLKAVPARVEAAFDNLIAQVDEMEKLSTDGIARATAVVADAKQGVQAVVDVVNQLTNGAPPALPNG